MRKNMTAFHHSVVSLTHSRPPRDGGTAATALNDIENESAKQSAGDTTGISPLRRIEEGQGSDNEQQSDNANPEDKPIPPGKSYLYMFLINSIHI